MANTLPTLQSAAWAMTGFLDTARELLQNDTTATELRLYFYAITDSGWGEIACGVRTWLNARAGRRILAYVGTDHALTEPAALDTMQGAQVEVRLLRRYNGVYHPKVMWFVAENAGALLVGSNNLTLDGLKNNIEFGALIRFTSPDSKLNSWHDAIHAASDPLTEALLAAYGNEKEAFGKARAKARVAGTFTWSKRASGGVPAATATGVIRPSPIGGPAAVGDLVVEIMPLETGTGGSQVQLPMAVARSYFGLPAGTNAQVQVSLRNVSTNDTRNLTMTSFRNRTARLVIRDLDYRHRPCVVVFHRTAPAGRSFDIEIVRESIDPNRYRGLVAVCGKQTRQGSRRWGIVPPARVAATGTRRQRT